MRKTIIVAVAFILWSIRFCEAESQFAFRGIWADPSAFSTPQATDKLIDQCKNAGLNAIVANVMMHGLLFYKSPHFLHKVVARDDFDPLSNLIEKAHAAGIKVHAWFCVYYEGGSSLSPARPDWICQDFDGNPISTQIFMSPAIPGVNDYLLSVIRDVLAYDIDGIHLDYIRYAGTPYDYSVPARQQFSNAYGFDPINFLDRGDSIVSPHKETFPIRMLHPNAHKSKPWQTTRIESLLDRAGIGFAWVSENPEQIASLPARSALILAHYYDVSDEMMTAIEQYVRRGGNLIWIDAPTTTLNRNKKLAELLGVRQRTRWVPSRWIRLQVADRDWSLFSPTRPCKAPANMAIEPTTAQVKIRLDSGEPVVLFNAYKEGKVVLINFSAGSATGDGMPRLVSGILGKLVPSCELGNIKLAAKRAQWIRWRADQVTALVRDVHNIAKQTGRNIAVSVAGGFDRSEYYTVYRDCKRWLSENLLDFGCPMDYTGDLQQFRHLMDEHIAIAPEGTLQRIYPGIALYKRDPSGGKPTAQETSVVREELKMISEKGFKGFIVFSSVQLTDEHIYEIARFSGSPKRIGDR